MKRGVHPRKKPVQKKRVNALALMDEPGGVEIVGNEIILHGKDAELVKEFCQRTGIPPEILLSEMLRVFVERCKVEKPKKVEEINWRDSAADLLKRLETWKQNRTAKKK